MKPELSQHCLLVVDQADAVQGVIDLLRSDHRVLGAATADEGLGILAREEVHVVMAGPLLPDMTGLEFLKIVQTTHADMIRLQCAADAGADSAGTVYRYVTRPWRPAELKAAVRQACAHFDLQAERKQLLRELRDKNRQLEAADSELRRANDIKKVFLRVASHELRTPLTVFLGLAEMACAAVPGHPKLRFWLEQMRRAAIA